MKKIALLSVPAFAVASFAQESGGMTTYADAGAAITAIGTTAQSAFNTFSTNYTLVLRLPHPITGESS